MIVFDLLKKVIGTKNERELKKMQPIVDLVNRIGEDLRNVSDEELKAKFPLFHQRVQNGEPLDDLLPEVYAVVREVADRVLQMRHFDVQIMGGIILHQGKIAEMATGEGKTLVATLPACLNALTGKGVHIITVNDYLARRDSEWMGKIYRFLGLSVGTIQHDMDEIGRKKAYLADITYGTNNEFGFDYLRDNMKFDIYQYVQRGHYYGIVDEVDSILIDEARTPLIISGPSQESTAVYYEVDRLIPKLRTEGDFTVDEKSRSVALTESGIAKAENFLKIENLYDPKHIDFLHHVNQALKAYALFKRDVDYVVKKGEVIIVDEFTGRLMPGRRYSEGLHQALEAKEKVKVENENQTLASITFQNYFRMYEKLAGMTGTAETEALEFKQIYDLDVVVVPTNRLLVRHNYPDVIYRTKEEKFKAVIREIDELYQEGRPVLVGTISIENSELLSKMLSKKKIHHSVLNAKYHEQEAEIVSQAGQEKSVTIATNMAGRGTDIVLGEGVAEKGGLHIIGTERHESRRIDNQLRGRAGRQGDPGSSRFYLSLDDDLLRIFGGERIASLMDRFGVEEGQPIEHKLLSRAIENAQKRVEGHNYSIRKNLLEYDDVMNKQREVIYSQRREVLEKDDLKEVVCDFIQDVLDRYIDEYTPANTYPEEWDFKGLSNTLKQTFTLDYVFPEEDIESLNQEQLKEKLLERILQVYRKKELEVGEQILRRHEKIILLHIIDTLWKDHLLAMDHLKEGIHLRGYGQKDPLIEYKKEGYEMFQDMIWRIKEDVTRFLFILQPAQAEEPVIHRAPRVTRESRGEDFQRKPKTVVRKMKKVGRNEPCPCGSNKKFKKCCGK